MKQQFLLFSLIFLFLAPFSQLEAKKRKRKVFPRKWSLSLVNAYSFHEKGKSNIGEPGTWTDLEDGQTQKFFSALELSRNFGQYEVGAKIQNTKHTFISPFLKWNLNKNYSRASIVPSFTVGVTPSILMGAWLRAGLGLSINRYMSLEPIIGAYAWTKIKDHPKYEKYGWHLHAGLRINLYY